MSVYDLLASAARFSRVSNLSWLKKAKFNPLLLFAGLLTASNWAVQTHLANLEQDKTKQIIRRVQEGKTSELGDLKDITKLDQLVGTRVQVTGSLEPNRFIVKRSRGDQEGYIVLAPFIVERQPTLSKLGATINHKYMVSLGWIPKESKHQIQQTIVKDVLKFDDLPEELVYEEDAPAVSTITAFVRRGEQRDVFRGRNNWTQDRLYKFIDLGLMESLFNANNHSFKYVYLDRAGEKEEDDSFPFPNNAENYIDELNEEIASNNKKRSAISKGVGVASFVLASLLAF